MWCFMCIFHIPALLPPPPVNYIPPKDQRQPDFMRLIENALYPFTSVNEVKISTLKLIFYESTSLH